MLPSFLRMSYFALDFFRSQNIYDVYFRSLTMLMLLENVTIRQIFVKHLTCVKVSNLVVTFFNGMGMSELRYKRQGYLRNKKMFKCKMVHTCKYQELNFQKSWYLHICV